MERAIRDHIVPTLRSAGFKGSFPHFRRPRSSQIDLLTFQFRLSGGSFVVELAACAPEGVTHSWRQVPPNKVTAHDIMQRHRLGSNAEAPDHWFLFGRPNYEPGSEVIEPHQHYVRVAQDVLIKLANEAPAFWGSGT